MTRCVGRQSNKLWYLETCAYKRGTKDYDLSGRKWVRKFGGKGVKLELLTVSVVTKRMMRKVEMKERGGKVA